MRRAASARTTEPGRNDDPRIPLTRIPAPSFGADPSQYAPVDEAIAQTFTATPGLPVAIAASLARVAPLLLLALAPGGVAWWRRAAIAGAVAAGWMLAVNARMETWDHWLHDILGILAIMAGSVIVLQLIRTKRLQPEALAALGLVFAFFHALSAIKPYFPVEGGE